MKKQRATFSYFDLLEVCTEPGCPFCRLADATVGRYLTSILYESVTDPEARSQLRRSLGFCNEHAWRLPDAGTGVALGIAIIYRDLMGTVLNELVGARFKRQTRVSLPAVQEALEREKPTTTTQAVVQRLQPQQGCPACAHRDKIETSALITLMDALAKQDERMQAALQASDGLCLPHLRRAFELARNETAFEALLAVTKEKLVKLQHELDEFIRKHDYRFQHEGFDTEGDSWQRAIGWAVGTRAVR
jgi:hypothetical protein